MNGREPRKVSYGPGLNVQPSAKVLLDGYQGGFDHGGHQSAKKRVMPMPCRTEIMLIMVDQFRSARCPRSYFHEFIDGERPGG